MKSAPILLLIVAVLFILLTSVAVSDASSSAPKIQLTLLDDEGRIPDCQIYVTLYYEKPEPAAIVDSWGRKRYPKHPLLGGPSPAKGEKVIFPIDPGKPLPGPGNYLLSIEYTVSFVETERHQIVYHKEATFEEHLKTQGFVKGAMGSDENGLYVVEDVRVKEKAFPDSVPRIEVAVDKGYYITQISWVRTHLSAHEEVDHVLATLFSSDRSISELRRKLAAMEKFSNPFFTEALTQLYPSLKSSYGATAVTLIIRAALAPQELSLVDGFSEWGMNVICHAKNLSSGAGIVVSLAAVYIPDAVVSAVQNSNFESNTATDDLETFAIADSSGSDLKKPRTGKVEITNRGEPIYDAEIRILRIQSIPGNPPVRDLMPKPVSLKKDKIGYGEKVEFEWVFTDFTAAPHLKFQPVLFYRSDPVGELNYPYNGPYYEHYANFGLNLIGITFTGNLNGRYARRVELYIEKQDGAYAIKSMNLSGDPVAAIENPGNGLVEFKSIPLPNGEYRWNMKGIDRTGNNWWFDKGGGWKFSVNLEPVLEYR